MVRYVASCLRHARALKLAPAASEAAARKCLDWRAANAAMLADAAAGKPPPKHDIIGPYCVAEIHSARSVSHEALYIVRAGLCNPAGLMRLVSTADFLQWLMYQKELAFRICDAETRERRVLVKMISIVDLSGVTLAMGSDSSYQRTIGDSGKLSEEVYPQLLARQAIIHPPSFFWVLFSIFKHFMSAKVMEKLGFCPGRSAERPSASACPFASVRFRLEDLPTFLGGTCRCTARGGCVAGMPNDQKAPASAAGAAVTVSAGSVHEVVLTAKHAGERLAWDFSLEDKGLEVSASVTPEAGGPPVTLLAARKYTKEDGAVAGTALVPVAVRAPCPMPRFACSDRVAALLQGAVTMRFDNTHSRFTSKTVRVTAVMLPPAEPPAEPADEA